MYTENTADAAQMENGGETKVTAGTLCVIWDKIRWKYLLS
jgi:hypothetical protein